MMENFGTVTFEDIEYTLTQNAFYWSEGKYAAAAIRTDEKDDPTANRYAIFWDIHEDFKYLNDEEGACDWAHPAEIVLVD